MPRELPKARTGPVSLAEQIIDLLKKKPMTTRQIRTVLGRELTDYNDALGRKMQKLRQQGVIKHDKGFGVWSLTNRRRCPHCDGTGFVSE